MPEPPIRLLRRVPFPKRQELVNGRARQVRHRIPVHLEHLMQFPIHAPVRHLDELIEGKVLDIDQQDSEIGVPCDCRKRFCDREAGLSDVSSFIVVL